MNFRPSSASLNNFNEFTTTREKRAKNYTGRPLTFWNICVTLLLWRWLRKLTVFEPISRINLLRERGKRSGHFLFWNAPPNTTTPHGSLFYSCLSMLLLLKRNYLKINFSTNGEFLSLATKLPPQRFTSDLRVHIYRFWASITVKYLWIREKLLLTVGMNPKPLD